MICSILKTLFNVLLNRIKLFWVKALVLRAAADYVWQLKSVQSTSVYKIVVSNSSLTGGVVSSMTELESRE